MGFERAAHHQSTPNDLQRRSTADQIAKLNDNVAKMLQAKVELLANFVHHGQMIDRMAGTLASLKTTVQQLVHNESTLLTHTRLTMHQNQCLMQHLGMAVTDTAIPAAIGTAPLGMAPPADCTPAAAHFNADVAAAQVTPTSAQDASATAEIATVTVAQPATKTPPPRNLNNALTRHNNPAPRRRGEKDMSEGVKCVLRSIHQANNDLLFHVFGTGAANQLSDHAAWVHAKIFNHRSRTKPKTQRALKLIDAVWIPEQRQTFIDHELDAFDIICVCEKLKRKVMGVAHVLRCDATRAKG